jgi:hypothetical protein
MVFVTGAFQAQNKKKSSALAEREQPSSFMISMEDFDNLLKETENSVIKNKGNKYLDGAIVTTSTTNGDMRYMKIRLAYFRNAHLNIQINGTDSRQAFILSDDKSLAYKGRFETANLVMVKTEADAIISE